MAKITVITEESKVIVSKKRVAAYARVSTANDEMEHSLSAQISYYSSIIQSNPEWTYAGVFSDYGISGTRITKRSGFQEMLRAADAGAIDIILTKSIQRFARNTVDLLKTVRHLKDIGVEVRFEKEHIRTLSGDGEVMLSILASYAQEESRSISANVKWGVRKRFENGIPDSHFNVYGYKWVGEDLIVVPDEAAIVKRIFQNFLDGKSRLETERELAAMGVRTRSGARWGDSSISGILTNNIYTGDLLLQKFFIKDPIEKGVARNRGELPQFLIEDHHEAIISKETFEFVQREMARRRELGVFGNKSLNTCCFTSKIRCPACGRNYQHARDSSANGLYGDYWICKTDKNHRCTIGGKLPDSILRQECCKVLGIKKFDENVFTECVDFIEVPERRTLDFHMKDGSIVRRTWTTPGSAAVWTGDKRKKHSELVHAAIRESRNKRFNEFSGKISCQKSGLLLYQSNVKDAASAWRCQKCPLKPECDFHGLPESTLRELAADVLGLAEYEPEIIRERIISVELVSLTELLFHLSDGTAVSKAWDGQKRHYNRRKDDAKGQKDSSNTQPLYGNTDRRQREA